MAVFDVLGPARGALSALRPYLWFFRFHYHITFAGVVVGALLYADEWTPSLFAQIGLVYVSLNLLLYPGLYAMNDIGDVGSDRRHPLKGRRPLAAGTISTKSAVVFSILFVTAGLSSAALLFPRRIVYVYISLLVLNLFYTFVAKNIVYLELVFNSLTHPARFLIGVFLVGATVSLAPLFGIFLFAFGIVIVRRMVEKDVEGWEARPTLAFYSDRELLLLELILFLGVVWLFFSDRSGPAVLYWGLVVAYPLFVFGACVPGPIRLYFRHTCTK